jgi:predicted DNA-binding protein (MmcQ/YjbR family)
MSRELVNSYCSTLTGANLSDPWGGGHDAWKVGGKLFAVIGNTQNGVSLKCVDVETAEILIEMAGAMRAPYFHRSWVFVPWGAMPDEELQARLSASYDIIRKSLPKKLQASLS